MLATDDSLLIGSGLAVTGPTVNLPQNSIAGAEVDESSFGAVPTATNATNATNADTLDSSTFQRQGRRDVDVDLPPSVVGINYLVLNAGPLEITNLTDGISGQVVTMISNGGGETVNDGGDFELAPNWPPTDDDTSP